MEVFLADTEVLMYIQYTTRGPISFMLSTLGSLLPFPGSFQLGDDGTYSYLSKPYGIVQYIPTNKSSPFEHRLSELAGGEKKTEARCSNVHTAQPPSRIRQRTGSGGRRPPLNPPVCDQPARSIQSSPTHPRCRPERGQAPKSQGPKSIIATHHQRSDSEFAFEFLPGFPSIVGPSLCLRVLIPSSTEPRRLSP